MSPTVIKEGSLTPREEQQCDSASLPREEADQVQVPPPVCCSLLPQSLAKPLSQYGGFPTCHNSDLRKSESAERSKVCSGMMSPTAESHFKMAKARLAKQRSCHDRK